MIRFGSPERDYSLSKGDMTLEKGLRSQHSRDVQLHDSLRLPTSIKRISYNFSLHVIAISCNCKKTWKVLCEQVFHKCVDSFAQFVNQNGLNSQLLIGLGGSQPQSNLNSKYVSGKYPNSFI